MGKSELDFDEVCFEIKGRIDRDMFEKFKAFIQSLDETKSLVYLEFHSEGGDFKYAVDIVNVMFKSGLKYWGVANTEVSSAAIFIFLNTHLQSSMDGAEALIHRFKKIKREYSDECFFADERKYMELISQHLDITIEEVYNLADKETIITENHPLGKKFFWKFLNS